MHSNLRFPHVFVYDNAVNALVTGGSAKPGDLAVGQVGIFDSATGLGLNGAAWTTSPKIFIAQKSGDNKFGIVRTKDIDIKQVKNYYGRIATTAVNQRTFYGWNGSAGDIDLKVGQELTVVINIYERRLARFYDPAPYTARIPVFLGGCVVCESDCTKLDPRSVADAIAAAINGTDAPAGHFPTQRETSNYLTATAIDNGLTGADKRAGVQIDAKAIAPDALNTCDPNFVPEIAFCHFTVGTAGDCNKPLVTTVQNGRPGSGYPAEVAYSEMESQGYDRVRNHFGDQNYMKLANYIINAQANRTYDSYIIDYDWTHGSKPSAASPASITEPYSAVIWVPRAGGTTFEAAFHAWIAGSGIGIVDIDTTTTTTTTTTT